LPETTGLINQNSLQTMKPTAYLINTARGELVVEEDLIAALKSE
jgi:D-3-phosphoglycerate dehydrogenase